MNEEQRAQEARALHRRQQANREAIGRKLSGSQETMRALEAAWSPIILAAIEARMEGDDADAE